MADATDPFPISVIERPLRFASTQTDPFRAAHEALGQMLRAHRDCTDALLARVAESGFHLNRAIAEARAEDDAGRLIDAVEIIAMNLQSILDEHDVRVRDLTGERWSIERRSEIELRGHQVREDATEPRIEFMELPIVHRNERLIAKGAAIIATPNREEQA